jgi:hypothetical protein
MMAGEEKAARKASNEREGEREREREREAKGGDEGNEQRKQLVVLLEVVLIVRPDKRWRRWLWRYHRSRT